MGKYNEPSLVRLVYCYDQINFKLSKWNFTISGYTLKEFDLQFWPGIYTVNVNNDKLLCTYGDKPRYKIHGSNSYKSYYDKKYCDLYILDVESLSLVHFKNIKDNQKANKAIGLKTATFAGNYYVAHQYSSPAKMQDRFINTYQYKNIQAKESLEKFDIPKDQHHTFYNYVFYALTTGNTKCIINGEIQQNGKALFIEDFKGFKLSGKGSCVIVKCETFYNDNGQMRVIKEPNIFAVVKCSQPLEEKYKDKSLLRQLLMSN